MDTYSDGIVFLIWKHMIWMLLQEKDATHIALLDIYDKSERETITDKELKSLLQEFE